MMSNAIFPIFPGKTWDVKKTPLFSTRIQRVIAGGETRTSQRVYPLWQFMFSVELLRNTGSSGELQSLMGLYLDHRGAEDSFLYLDPDDYTVATQAIATGDTVTTDFQLARTWAGFTEPVTDLVTDGGYANTGSPLSMTWDTHSHKIILKDSANKEAIGWFKLAGTSKTYDTTLILNGTVWTGATGATPPIDWTVGVDGTFTIFNGGTAPHDVCLKLEVDATPHATPYIYQAVTTIIGTAYKFSFDFKKGTAISGEVGIGTTATGGEYQKFSTLTDAAWATHVLNFTATSTTTYIYLKNNSSTIGETCLFDTVALTQILTPATTGATIVSTDGGSTRNWTSIDGSFNYNDASGYTFEIFDYLNVSASTGTISLANIVISLVDGTAFIDQNLATVLTDYCSLYDTFSKTGNNITSAIKSTVGDKVGATASITTLTAGKFYRVVATLTLNSGVAPVLTGINGVPDFSATDILSSGANTIIFKATSTATTLTLLNTSNGNWSCTFTLYEVTQTLPVINVYVNSVWQSPNTYIPNYHTGNTTWLHTGIISFLTAPGAYAITADFSFYYRVRFAEYEEDGGDGFNQFMKDLWELGSVSLITAR